jgi:hypothetical protein
VKRQGHAFRLGRGVGGIATGEGDGDRHRDRASNAESHGKLRTDVRRDREQDGEDRHHQQGGEGQACNRDGVTSPQHGAGYGDRNNQEQPERICAAGQVEQTVELENVEGQLPADFPGPGVASIRCHQGEDDGQRRHGADQAKTETVRHGNVQRLARYQHADGLADDDEDAQEKVDARRRPRRRDPAIERLGLRGGQGGWNRCDHVVEDGPEPRGTRAPGFRRL